MHRLTLEIYTKVYACTFLYLKKLFILSRDLSNTPPTNPTPEHTYTSNTSKLNLQLL